MNRILADNIHIHISIDIDVIDPAFAPGVSNPVAGGITTRQLLLLLNSLVKIIKLKKIKSISWDIVEFVPSLDISQITGFGIVKLLIEILGYTYSLGLVKSLTMNNLKY